MPERKAAAAKTAAPEKKAGSKQMSGMRCPVSVRGGFLRNLTAYK